MIPAIYTITIIVLLGVVLEMLFLPGKVPSWIVLPILPLAYCSLMSLILPGVLKSFFSGESFCSTP
jgi:hypothetical protein